MRTTGRVLFMAAVLALVSTPVSAVIRYGNAQIAGSLYTQGMLQHDGIGDWEFVQNRNLLNFTFQYDLIERNEAFGLHVPFVDSMTFYAQYRGAFDPVFRIRDRYDDIIENPVRNQVESENTLRDVYLDVATSSVGPGRLSVRIGKQQVVWGEADVVRSLDIINPLDLRKNFLLGPDQPNLNEYRIPLWMLKVLYSWREFGPIANSGLEMLWIPGDIEPLRAYVGEALNFPFDMERRPSSRSFDRVRHPFAITRIGPNKTEIPAQAVLSSPGNFPEPLASALGATTGPIVADLIWFDRTQPFAGILPPHNDVPSRAWIRNSEVGARFFGQVAPFGKTIDFSLNYLYMFSDLPGAFADFPAIADALFTNPGTRDPDTGAGLTFGPTRDLGSDVTIWIPAALEYPRTHVFGSTLTYSDVDFTGAIWRLELSHQTDDPRIKPRPPFIAEREGEFTFEDFEQTFRATGDTTRLMIGADLFRSFPFLDPILGPGQPLFVSGQYFLEYKNNISNTIGPLLDPTDDFRRWNPLYTLLVQYFFKGGQWVPILITIYDQDAKHLAIMPAVEYNPKNWLTLKFGQIWFTGSKFNQSSRFLHAFADRDQTFLRIQYSF